MVNVASGTDDAGRRKSGAGFAVGCRSGASQWGGLAVGGV